MMSITNGKEVFLLNESVRGYSHILKNLPCQDFSDNYQDYKKIILTACDGHGGRIYIRSDRGSKFASDAAIKVLKKYRRNQIECMIANNNLDAIKFEILCKWNELVEQDYSRNPFAEEETNGLDENELFDLRLNPVLAYGSTLNAALITSKYIVCVQIGDGGMFLITEQGYQTVFEENDENVANVTYSLCGDKAFNNIFVNVFDSSDVKGVVLCTDGVLGPYQTYSNFEENFISPIEQTILEEGELAAEQIKEFITVLGEEKGNGDDVSLSICYFK